MATDVHLVKKSLFKPANRTINVNDLVKRNKLERKEEKKHNLILFSQQTIDKYDIYLYINFCSN